MFQIATSSPIVQALHDMGAEICWNAALAEKYQIVFNELDADEFFNRFGKALSSVYLGAPVKPPAASVAQSRRCANDIRMAIAQTRECIARCAVALLAYAVNEDPHVCAPVLELNPLARAETEDAGAHDTDYRTNSLREEMKPLIECCEHNLSMARRDSIETGPLVELCRLREYISEAQQLPGDLFQMILEYRGSGQQISHQIKTVGPQQAQIRLMLMSLLNTQPKKVRFTGWRETTT
jgi:hypothetical protein